MTPPAAPPRAPAPRLRPWKPCEHETDLTRLYLADLPPWEAAHASQVSQQLQEQADPGPGAEPTAPRGQLIQAHLRLVVRVARAYAPLLRRVDASIMTLDDLIQEGNLGLIQAAQHFDPGRGYRFSTYATWWIRSAIVRALQAAGAVRLPDHLRYRRRQPVPRLRVSSLSARAGGDAPDLLDLPDPAGVDPLSSLLEHEQQQWLREALQGLPARQRQILEALLGLGQEAPHPLTMAQLAQGMGLSRERVRQLKQAALRHLRAAWEQQQAPPGGANTPRPGSQAWGTGWTGPTF
jgi:RNA polymerase primary sigma factor